MTEPARSAAVNSRAAVNTDVCVYGQRFPAPRSAYIHVPFCAHRCGYCDFTLISHRDDLIEDYLQAMSIELARLDEPRPVDTIFLGGGTPTHLSPCQLSRLLQLLKSWFRLEEGCEFSVEANPSGLTAEKIAVLAEGGVNRVSLGVQSFNACILKLLERDHRRDDVQRAVELLRESIRNFSFDLIFGVPGQSLDLWRETLAEAMCMAPAHMSTYGLTFERGTTFWARKEKGELGEADELLQREMYACAIDTLAAGGYEQYEISNFALPGRRCRHNEIYWQGLPFFGFGPGAARYIDGRRETNHRSVRTWLSKVLAGESPIGESEALSPEDRAREAIVIGLRACDGIQKDDFCRRTGYDIDDLARTTIDHYIEAGLLEEVGKRLRLTREGRFMADTVFIDFL